VVIAGCSYQVVDTSSSSEVLRWTRESFENLRLYRLRGTIRYPVAA
jgi:hypothetical protein